MTEERGLIRFLIEFEQPKVPEGEIWLDGDPWGPTLVGVTGCDREDALALVGQHFWPDGGMPSVESVLEDVDVSAQSLDGRFVGVPIWRGVWYPVYGL